ncbi:hypothetical protein J1G42_02175 [Cellulomonas sp. zg-ZUI222]|uniref:hypothetical protein n=1 Tax=Cellulomonas wangleii TaxID=2816956 RepID=UPI001A95368F|nr:hypothetical protein [Cellulomonas wangleii]MBO0919630.1 hypothetical protein [Cellulomonas wangleii]
MAGASPAGRLSPPAPRAGRARPATAGSPRLTEAYAALGAEVALLLLHARARYEVPALVDEHTAYLADVQTRGPAAVREHLTHLADLLHPPA